MSKPKTLQAAAGAIAYYSRADQRHQTEKLVEARRTYAAMKLESVMTELLDGVELLPEQVDHLRGLLAGGTRE